MNINATLLGQMITFILFIWFTMKYVWPPITKALADRQVKIAEGLAAGERGEKALELAKEKTTQQLREAKKEASHILDQANHRANEIIEAAKVKAREEGERLIALAQQDIVQEVLQAKRTLREQVAHLVVQGAEKIIAKQIDKAANQALLDDLIKAL